LEIERRMLRIDTGEPGGTYGAVRYEPPNALTYSPGSRISRISTKLPLGFFVGPGNIVDSTGRGNVLSSKNRERVVPMKQRHRIYCADAQKALMWDRWEKGDSLHDIARLFN